MLYVWQLINYVHSELFSLKTS